MATSITLTCLAVDRGRNPLGTVFVMDVSPRALVSHLRRAIKSEKSHQLDHLDADQLVLWKLSPPIPTGVTEAEATTFNQRIKAIEFPNPARSEALEGNGPVQVLSPAQKISRYWQDGPEESDLHLIVQVPHDRKRKREESVDISAKLYLKWNVPLPRLLNVTDLGVYLDAPLETEEKIPISHPQWRSLLHTDPRSPELLCFPADLEMLFIENEDETASFVWRLLDVAIHGPPPDSDGTESSFISFWDENILKILKAGLGKLKWIRNNNRGTNTGSFRPGLGLLLQSVCLFRGEEKCPSFFGKHPRQELVDKTRWAYGRAPYVLGYYAIGANITLVAIQPVINAQGIQKIVVQDILKADLSTRQGRIRNATMMIRLVKVLRALECIVDRDVDTDMFLLERENRKCIEFFRDKIRKTYPIEDGLKISFLESIYGKLKAKSVPNVDTLMKFGMSHPEYGCFVELAPRGNHHGPESAEDVKNAVICVLEVLQVLHTEPPVFHRDIRWPNVMQNLTNSKQWFLIDWEDAAIPPTKAALNLDSETHAPQVFKDGHGAEVDLWGVGNLITEAPVCELPQSLHSFGWNLVKGSILSAEQGLRELKSL
ncbi:uncharacterized protein EI90DRAFT_3072322 [Cantharellus anzutake]|uniref:uncharacterized protein n=1 Tax=Cantharellus anzutake TaxID=1750568 RepID=UPI001904CE15|nr:uncharacterized protein EI90DRAFT_3072322 [Cantharellus anzutake]KAF8325636.1 hypothetical protein EI90DRAFT_3072322 [Cantharellus anzutake]